MKIGADNACRLALTLEPEELAYLGWTEGPLPRLGCEWSEKTDSILLFLSDRVRSAKVWGSNGHFYWGTVSGKINPHFFMRPTVKKETPVIETEHHGAPALLVQVPRDGKQLPALHRRRKKEALVHNQAPAPVLQSPAVLREAILRVNNILSSNPGIEIRVENGVLKASILTRQEL